MIRSFGQPGYHGNSSSFKKDNIRTPILHILRAKSCSWQLDTNRWIHCWRSLRETIFDYCTPRQWNPSYAMDRMRENKSQPIRFQLSTICKESKHFQGLGRI